VTLSSWNSGKKHSARWEEGEDVAECLIASFWSLALAEAFSPSETSLHLPRLEFSALAWHGFSLIARSFKVAKACAWLSSHRPC